MVVVKPTDGIDAHALRGQGASDFGNKAHGFQGTMNVQGDHATGEFIRQLMVQRLLVTANERCALHFLKHHDGTNAGRNWVGP